MLDLHTRVKRLRGGADRAIQAELAYHEQVRRGTEAGRRAAQAERIAAAEDLCAGLIGHPGSGPVFTRAGYAVLPPERSTAPITEPCRVWLAVSLDGDPVEILTRGLTEAFRSGLIKPDAGAG